MKNSVIDNIYGEGDIVYAKADPGVKLVIRRYLDRIYYCTIDDDSSRKELVYYERELTNKPENSKDTVK